MSSTEPYNGVALGMLDLLGLGDSLQGVEVAGVVERCAGDEGEGFFLNLGPTGDVELHDALDLADGGCGCRGESLGSRTRTKLFRSGRNTIASVLRLRVLLLVKLLAPNHDPGTLGQGHVRAAQVLINHRQLGVEVVFRHDDAGGVWHPEAGGGRRLRSGASQERRDEQSRRRSQIWRKRQRRRHRSDLGSKTDQCTYKLRPEPLVAA